MDNGQHGIHITNQPLPLIFKRFLKTEFQCKIYEIFRFDEIRKFPDQARKYQRLEKGSALLSQFRFILLPLRSSTRTFQAVTLNL
jgi:hypothetical protein